MDTLFSDAVSDTIIPPNPTDGEYNDEIIDDPELLTQSIEGLRYTFNNALEDTDGLANVIVQMTNVNPTERSQVTYEAYMLAAEAYSRRQNLSLTTVSVECYPINPTDTWTASLESIADAWRRMVAYLRDLIARIVNRVRVWFSTSAPIKNKRAELVKLKSSISEMAVSSGSMDVADPSRFTYCQVRTYDVFDLNVLRAAKAYVDLADFVFKPVAKEVHRFANDYMDAMTTWMASPDTMHDLHVFDKLNPPKLPSMVEIPGSVEWTRAARWCHCPAVTAVTFDNPPEWRISVADYSVSSQGMKYEHPTWEDIVRSIDKLIELLDIVVDSKMVIYDSLQLEGKVVKLVDALGKMKPTVGDTSLMTLAQPLMGSVQSYASFIGVMALQMTTVVSSLTDVIHMSLKPIGSSNG